MNDFFEVLGIQAVLITVGVVIGLVLYGISAVKDQNNMPDATGREEVVEEIRQLNEQGLNYNEKLAVLRKKGFRRKVADQLLAEEMLRHKSR